VLRNTRSYAAALRHGRVTLPPVPGLPDGPASRRILAAERRALSRGDIPLFEADFDDHDLRDESRVIVPGFFERSGRETIAARSRIGPTDARNAVRVLRSCLRIDAGGLKGRPCRHIGS
jgi:hypothetical protein